jgi:DNA-3-methyladenine glycosylase
MKLKKLPRSFYLHPTLTVARELLGKYLIRNVHQDRLVGKIVEVEAYLGKKDPASHTYRGKTKRNEVMFLEGGHLYVYFTYGMHFCANVVTEREGIGHAVLLRAVEPLEGIDVMRKNRRFRSGEPDRGLTNGPAKLCQAFGINQSQNGIDLLGDELWISDGEWIQHTNVERSSRIGIRRGTEKKWRFYLKNSIFISRP